MKYGKRSLLAIKAGMIGISMLGPIVSISLAYGYKKSDINTTKWKNWKGLWNLSKSYDKKKSCDFRSLNNDSTEVLNWLNTNVGEEDINNFLIFFAQQVIENALGIKSEDDMGRLSVIKEGEITYLWNKREQALSFNFKCNLKSEEGEKKTVVMGTKEGKTIAFMNGRTIWDNTKMEETDVNMGDAEEKNVFWDDGGNENVFNGMDDLLTWLNGFDSHVFFFLGKYNYKEGTKSFYWPNVILGKNSR